MKKCMYCDTIVDDKTTRCTGCGAFEFYKLCPKCKKYYEGIGCPDCEENTWSKIDKEKFTASFAKDDKFVPDDVSPKSKTVALLLCLFLGVLGVHNFYVGRVGRGVLFLFTEGIFGFGVIYDFIMILLNKYKDSDGLPLSEW